MKKPCSSREVGFTLDVVNSCDCCSYDDLLANEFLHAFAENLPEEGSIALLRLRFKVAFRRRKGAAILPSEAVLLELERRGIVERDGDAIVAVGLFSRACANDH